MNHAAVKCFEVIVYAFIEALSMQAANEERGRKGEAQAYPEEAFIRVAEHMRGQVADNASYIG